MVGSLAFCNAVGLNSTIHLESLSLRPTISPGQYYSLLDVWGYYPGYPRILENLGKNQPKNEEPLEINFMAIDPSSYLLVTNFVFSEGMADENAALSELNAGGSVLVSSVLSEKYDLDAGDQIWLKTRSGPKAFNVVEVIVDFFNQGLIITGNYHDLNRYFRSDDVSTILIKTENNIETSEVMRNIEDVYGKRYRLSMESNTDIRESIFTLMNQAFSLFDVMAILAVMIASLGIMNTLTMNIMERTQEIGMLRAIGMTRGQIIKMVLAESGLMGVIGALLVCYSALCLEEYSSWACLPCQDIDWILLYL